jgi:hypothetical protein
LVKDGAELVKIVRPGKFGQPNDFLTHIHDQLAYVRDWSELRTDRLAEILLQIPTPQPFFNSVCQLTPTRYPHTMALLSLAYTVGSIVVFSFKHALGVPRPAALAPDIMPVIGTPEHSALPSGHAAEAALVANLLLALAPPRTSTLLREPLSLLAGNVAVNRMIAGVHYPMDSWAGMMVGNALAKHFFSQLDSGITIFPAGESKQQREYQNRVEPQNAIDEGKNFHATDMELNVIASVPQMSAPATPLQWLWQQAQAEWKA